MDISEGTVLKVFRREKKSETQLTASVLGKKRSKIHKRLKNLHVFFPVSSNQKAFFWSFLCFGSVVKAINARKTSGPDGGCNCVPSFTSSSRPPYMHDKQNVSDMEYKCHHSSPKESNPTSLNYFRPVTLTSLAMKYLEKIFETGVFTNFRKESVQPKPSYSQWNCWMC